MSPSAIVLDVFKSREGSDYQTVALSTSPRRGRGQGRSAVLEGPSCEWLHNRCVDPEQKVQLEHLDGEAEMCLEVSPAQQKKNNNELRESDQTPDIQER